MSNLRIAICTALAVIVIVCLFVGVDLAFAVAMTATGHYMNMQWMAEISVLWLILAFWVLPKDWMAINRRYSCRGSAVIRAPIDQVWDAVRLRPRTESFRPVVTKITADLTQVDRFYYHFDPRLSGEGSNQPSRVAVQVTDAEAPHYMRLEYPHSASLSGWAKDVLCSEVFLEQTEGGVQVTFIEHLRRLTVPTLFSLMFVNPSRDAACGLKAWVEGTEDHSYMGTFMADLGPDGSLPSRMRSTLLVASISGFVTLSAIAFGIISFILFALPGS